MTLRAVVALVYSTLVERADALMPNEEKPGTARANLDSILDGPAPVRVDGRSRRKAAVAAELEGLKKMGRNAGVQVG